jgi:hypothetical protein
MGRDSEEPGLEDFLAPVLHPVNFDPGKPYLAWLVPLEVPRRLFMTLSQMVYTIRVGHAIEEGDHVHLLRNFQAGKATTPLEWVKRNRLVLNGDLEFMYPGLNRSITLTESLEVPWMLRVRLSNDPDAEVFELQGHILKHIHEALEKLWQAR